MEQKSIKKRSEISRAKKMRTSCAQEAADVHFYRESPGGNAIFKNDIRRYLERKGREKGAPEEAKASKNRSQKRCKNSNDFKTARDGIFGPARRNALASWGDYRGG